MIGILQLTCVTRPMRSMAVIQQERTCKCQSSLFALFVASKGIETERPLGHSDGRDGITKVKIANANRNNPQS
jgi:hypothetical protein